MIIKWIVFAFVVLFLNCNAKVERQNAEQTLAQVDTAVQAVEVRSIEMDSIPIQTEAAPFDVNYLMGKFNPAQHPDFVKIAPPYADNNARYLRKDVYEAFKKMHAAALKDSVQLVIISATRNFEAQKGIWEAKWTGERLVNDADISKTIPDPRQRALKILEYSSMPGSSRHHWGTDIDLNDLSDAHFQTGKGKKVYDWLRTHAQKFGFCQPYSKKNANRPNGYNEEKWHWSYTPVSQKLTTLAKSKLKDELIQGFKGAETAKNIGIVKKYVLGINQECLK